MPLITEPTQEPVTLQEAKRHAIIEHDDWDSKIDGFIIAARRHVEQLTQRSLVRQKHRLYLDQFCQIGLPFGPVNSIESVTYIDIDGAEQTVSTSVYELDPSEDKILLSFGQTWPGARSQKNAVWVDYWCGYFVDASPVTAIALRDNIPADIKVAINMYVSDMVENIGITSDIQMYENKAFDSLINFYRIYT